MKKLLAAIAKMHLSLETLETRNSDSLDFSDQAVWSIEAALKEAFIAGQEAGNIIILTGQGDDYWNRPTFKDQHGTEYVMVDYAIHTVTAEGEPISPLTKKYFIED